MKKRSSSQKKTTAREKIADTLDFSKEILLDTSKITAIGNREMTVENYRGILEYGNKRIRLLSQPYTIDICGDFLEIKTMTRDFLYITGTLKSVAFCLGEES